jgi:hypothetical protein
MMDDKKIYYGERLEKPIILENKEYEGYEYYIITLGSHPCCYVLLPKGHNYHGEHYDDIPIKCHFGLTYSEPTLLRDNIITGGQWVIGWDYAHIGDYSIFHLPLMESTKDGHKWTLDELRNEVKEVINQLAQDDRADS